MLGTIFVAGASYWPDLYTAAKRNFFGIFTYHGVFEDGMVGGVFWGDYIIQPKFNIKKKFEYSFVCFSAFTPRQFQNNFLGSLGPSAEILTSFDVDDLIFSNFLISIKLSFTIRFLKCKFCQRLRQFQYPLK